MKKSLLALAVLGAFAGVAQAQTSVTVYGSFDGGVRYVKNVNAAGDSRLSVGSNGTYNSNRLGFKGVEDLGGGLNARFNLETGFNTGTGAVESTTGSFGSTTPGNGFFWNRTATVGLGGAWGGIDIGHQYSVSFKTIGLYDPFNYKYTGIIPLAGISAGNGTTSVFGGTRFNNDIQYTGTFGPITARAEYSLGEVAGSNARNSAYAGGLSYTNGPLAVAGAYTQKKASTVLGPLALAPTAGGVATTPAATTPAFSDRAWTLGAAYTFGAFRVSGGYNDERVNDATTALASTPGADSRQRVGWAGVGFDITPAVNVTGAWYNTRVNTTATAPTAALPLGVVGDGTRNLFIVGATYAFSKRTNAYAEVDYTKLKGNQIVGAGTAATQDKVTGVSVGINHLF